jgi:hypothetical protein
VLVFAAGLLVVHGEPLVVPWCVGRVDCWASHHPSSLLVVATLLSTSLEPFLGIRMGGGTESLWAKPPLARASAFVFGGVVGMNPVLLERIRVIGISLCSLCKVLRTSLPSPRVLCNYLHTHDGLGLFDSFGNLDFNLVFM